MSAVTRRSFLSATAAAAATAATAGRASAQSAAGSGSSGPAPGPVPTVEQEHRVVVVGSGFGGGIAALRLTRAGVPVTVLERGRRWPTGPNANTFPSPSNPDKRMLWHKSLPEVFGRKVLLEPYVGLLETFGGNGMTAICAAGVGGGSLLYQGMSLEPTRELFNTYFPEELDWELMHREHYPRVARMLQLATAPDDVVASEPYRAARIFATKAKAAGLPVSKIPMPIDWDFVRAELRGEMRPSYTNGDGAFGVNNGGKHSVDVTYVAAAEATGLADVRTCHEVTDVERAPDGRWRVLVDRTDESGTPVERIVMTTPALVMAAGSVNTTRLLVKARAEGRVPDLPDALGEGWGTNGDQILGWIDPRLGFGSPQGGPVVYGTKLWDDPATAHTLIQASIPPLSIDARSTVMVGYGVSPSRGTVRYTGDGNVTLDWPAGGDRALMDRSILPTAHRIAGPDTFLLNTNTLVNSTWHPLGGACMGTVCDLEGRVHGQRGLYVLDGALMPGTTAACNPSMTIAAVAERAMDRIVASDGL